jgi:Zn-dependent peptidase ImmA (M78 family)
MVDLNELSAQEIGRRLKVARETAGLKQDEAAQFIDVSRPTLVSIEKGGRPPRIQELQILAKHYGTSVNALLRREAIHEDLLPRFRKLKDTEDADTIYAVRIFNNLISADVELENLLGVPRHRNYPPEKGINQGDVIELAEKHAEELRSFLGLGPGPIADIFSIIELTIGIRLYQSKLPPSSKIAGLFTYNEAVGACIFLNINHPLPKRVQSAAHELGHFYGTRQNPEVLEFDEIFTSREERYANAFGRAFLTPASSFIESFRKLKAITSPDKISRRLVVLLSHQFNISREACIRRMEELSLAPKGTFDWFQDHGGIPDKQADSILGDLPRPADPWKSGADRLLSHRLSWMAHTAWKRELLSEGELANLLDLTRPELRGIIDEIETEDKNSDELFKCNR